MAATTLTDRVIVRLSGENVRGFLQGLVTSDVAGPLPVWAGLLTPQGKCLFDFIVWPDDAGSGDDLLLDCEAEAADDLIKRLSIYRLRRPITIAGENGPAVHWSTEPGQGIPDPRLTALGNRWLAPAGESTDGRAELGDLLWLECNAAELNGVSFTKGCFVGQENTARMNWRQKINRRLVVVPGASERVRAEYPDLGLAVVHARIDAIPDSAIIPDWLANALAQASTA